MWVNHFKKVMYLTNYFPKEILPWMKEIVKTLSCACCQVIAINNYDIF
jgi:hypothetical protein